MRRGPTLPGDPYAPSYSTPYTILCGRLGVSRVYRRAGVYLCACGRPVPRRLLVT
jgi:hypothetical protein